MQTLKLIWKREADADEGAATAKLVLTELNKLDSAFRLWLVGDLGVGKTFIAGQLLHALGLSPKVPVTSPTYTYCNEYQIGQKWYAHIDLYRAGPNLSLEDLGLVDARSYQGYLIEWPEQVPAHPVIACDFVLKIEFDGMQSRRYSLWQATAAS